MELTQWVGFSECDPVISLQFESRLLLALSGWLLV